MFRVTIAVPLTVRILFQSFESLSLVLIFGSFVIIILTAIHNRHLSPALPPARPRARGTE